MADLLPGRQSGVVGAIDRGWPGAASGRPIDSLLADHGIVALTSGSLPLLRSRPNRPIPSEFEKTARARDGRALTLRPIRPEDEPALQAFVLRQSPEDRRLRFFLQVKELNH